MLYIEVIVFNGKLVKELFSGSTIWIDSCCKDLKIDYDQTCNQRKLDQILASKSNIENFIIIPSKIIFDIVKSFTLF